MTSDTPIELEVCVASVEGAVSAEKGGATRIELCSALEVGGLTPSYGLIAAVKAAIKIPVHVLIRPRAGGFVYSENERDVISRDIGVAAVLKCEGVVLGALTPDGRVNAEVVRAWTIMAHENDMKVTFHRAFDDLADQSSGLQDIISCQCDRLLTSGGKSSAAESEAIERLHQLVQNPDNSIIIMPGAGITPDNVRSIVVQTHARAIHASCKRQTIEGEKKGLFAVTQWTTDEETVRQMHKILSEL